jgi:hypothetical protein
MIVPSDAIQRREVEDTGVIQYNEGGDGGVAIFENEGERVDSDQRRMRERSVLKKSCVGNIGARLETGLQKDMLTEAAEIKADGCQGANFGFRDIPPGSVYGFYKYPDITLVPPQGTPYFPTI